jgi:DNA processing protein
MNSFLIVEVVMPVSDEVRARLYLMRATRPTMAMHDFVAAHGAVDAATRIRDGCAPRAVAFSVVDRDARIDADLAAIADGTARLVTPADRDWPGLGRMAARNLVPPLALWVRGTGSLAAITRTAVAVTGAAAPTGYGERIAANIANRLGRTGIAVIAGGALGIDAVVHTTAIQRETRTVVVLPCGIDRVHPHQHGRLFGGVVVSGGLLVSAYPCGATSNRDRMVDRSVLIAALASVTVIVEASLRSRALHTAHAARQLGRRVYAIPGPITSAVSAGTNRLISIGEAIAVAHLADIDQHDGLP